MLSHCSFISHEHELFLRLEKWDMDLFTADVRQPWMNYVK